MHSHMLLQIGVGREGLVAELARERLHFFMNLKNKSKIEKNNF